MDTITHTLLGLTTYGAIKKENIDAHTKRALLFSAVVGSQIPDIDIVANLSETGRIMGQMWHRGLTHSLFLTPIWAIIIYGLAILIWKRKDAIIFHLAWLNVLIHDGTDALNTWGTGLLEPFSTARITLGFISIVDFIIWGIILIGFLLIKLRKNLLRYQVWRGVWIVILMHIGLQSLQGAIIQYQFDEKFEQVELSADFIPGHFSVIAKSEESISIYEKTVWSKGKLVETLYSAKNADLERLFEENPRAAVLNEWSPFVVVVANEETIGIYDPRFYSNGSSFLTESITLESE
ncbi:metal-dependent hydrolase [Bacillus solitudinis]|uniref:metal-dependent hydrolase n=1 Tax=Bacillus solitudinis TaxID=2014074 RepID=UPI000C24CE0D|nr:metal-dependent hydrolase [Bacillus solitudinis]